MSDGTYGVLFNDSTKIVVSKDNYQFYYLSRDTSSKPSDLKGTLPIYDFNVYPDELKKKVILTQHFISYLMGDKFLPSQIRPKDFEHEFTFTEKTVMLKKYSRENKAILLRLNNKMIQVIFLDKSELILGSDSGSVNFITSKGDVRSTTISSDMKSYSSLESSDPSLYKRLNYAKEMLMNLINPKNTKKPKTKKTMFGSKNFRSETKENNYQFTRKNSENSDNIIEFYATQNLKHDVIPEYNIEDPAPAEKDKIEEVVKGAAAEIRKKLANYNSNSNESTKPDLSKSSSYKVTLKKASLDQKCGSRSPQSYGLYSKSNNGFNTNTQKVLGSKVKSLRQNPLTVGFSQRDDLALKQSKSGRTSSNTNYNRIENVYSSDVRIPETERACPNYFTTGPITSRVNLNIYQQ